MEIKSTKCNVHKDESIMNCHECKDCIVWKTVSKNKKILYYISSHGEIYSNLSNKMMSVGAIRGGYKSVTLRTGNDDSTTRKIHQLVAQAFLPRPKDKNIVNHIDGNKFNNHVSNLEWTDLQGNCQHAVDKGLTKITKRRVNQYDLEGNLIETHDTIRGASFDCEVDAGAIAKVCKGRRKTAGGFVWEFADENPNEKKIDLTDFVQIKDFPNYMINKESVIYSKPYKKIMKQQTNNDGYLGIQLSNKGKRKSFLVHRLVALHFIKQEKGKDYVNHKNGNKKDNSSDNLEWVTNSENIKHFHHELKSN